MGGNNLVEATCHICGKLFLIEKQKLKRAATRNAGGFVYCSKECVGKAKKLAATVEAVCHTCGKKFLTPAYKINRALKNHKGGHVYCSKECVYKARTDAALVEVTCPTCGKKFLVTRARLKYRTKASPKGRIYCSPECAHKGMKTYKICPVCGKSFHWHSGQIYCSSKCFGKVLSEIMKHRPRKPYNWRIQRPDLIRTCPVCGKTFKKKTVRPGVEKIYCSRACFSKQLSSRFEKAHLTCLNCGKEFVRIKHYSGQKFCSHSCYDEYRRKTVVKEVEERGYFSKQGQEIKREEVVLYISRTHGYKCAVCGRSRWNGKHLTLIVDHIDGNADNNAIENIRLVCPNCDSQSPTWMGRNKFGRKRRREAAAINKTQCDVGLAAGS